MNKRSWYVFLVGMGIACLGVGAFMWWLGGVSETSGMAPVWAWIALSAIITAVGIIGIALNPRFKVYRANSIKRPPIRILFVLVLLAACRFPLAAQITNAHADFEIVATGNLGYHNPQFGGEVGGDLNLGKLVVSADGNFDHVVKNVGGPGHQISARETARYFVKGSPYTIKGNAPNLFIQGGLIEQKYSVQLFSKSSIQLVAGAGTVLRSGLIVVEGNFRDDVISENHQRIGEARVTLFLAHHIFARGSLAIDHFVDGKQTLTGAAERLGIGVWF